MTFMDGYWSGYRDYRDGARKPVTLAGKTRKPPPLVSGEKRKRAVNEAMDLMRDWRQTPFETEGLMVAALRSAWCLKGYNWTRSDVQARAIVSEALRLLGATRPTYGQGQWEYTLDRDTCVTCLGPLDAEDIAARRRFCCRECSDVKRVADAQRYDWLMKRFHRKNGRDRKKESSPGRVCARDGCGKTFQSIDENARYCCMPCFHLDCITVQERSCQQCAKIFRPRSNRDTGRFCSVECTNESFRQVRIHSACECCGKPFIAHNVLGKYCSVACKKLYGRVKRGQFPRIITATSFDWLFHSIRQQARLSAPIPSPAITAELFDGWFRRAA